MKLPLSLGLLALSIATVATPALAGPMTKAQMATAAKCKAAAKKSGKCVAFMKAHPDAAMMAHDGAMMAPEGGMMSDKK